MKRIFLLLSLCLLLVVAGCAGQEPSQQEPEQSGQTVESQEPDEAAEPQQPVKPDQAETQESEQPDQEEEAQGPEEPGQEEELQETPEDTYAVCTSLSVEEVETFAAQVRQAVLDKDWDSLAQMTCYDIKVGENTFADSAEFAAADWDSVFSEDFIQAIEEESCREMFCNWQGVMMGDGQIWFSEVLDMDGNSEGLKVVAINLEA